jgi:hypothetical protein
LRLEPGENEHDGSSRPLRSAEFAREQQVEDVLLQQAADAYLHGKRFLNDAPDGFLGGFRPNEWEDLLDA